MQSHCWEPGLLFILWVTASCPLNSWSFVAIRCWRDVWFQVQDSAFCQPSGVLNLSFVLFKALMPFLSHYPSLGGCILTIPPTRPWSRSLFSDCWLDGGSFCPLCWERKMGGAFSPFFFFFPFLGLEPPCSWLHSFLLGSLCFGPWGLCGAVLFLSLFLLASRICSWVKMLVAQSCPTLWDPVDCSLPSSSVPWDSPGKNTGVGCPALMQGIFLTQGLNLELPHSREILYRWSHQ